MSRHLAANYNTKPAPAAQPKLTRHPANPTFVPRSGQPVFLWPGSPTWTILMIFQSKAVK